MAWNSIERTNPKVASDQAAGLGHILRGAGSLYAGTIIQLAGRLLFAILVARWVGADAVGIFTVGFVAIQTFAIIATSGVEVGLYHFVSPAFKNGNFIRVNEMLWAAVGTTVTAGILLSLIYVIIIPMYPLTHANGESSGFIFQLFAPALLFHVIVTVLGGFGLAIGSSRIRVIAERVVGTIVQIVSLVAFLSMGMGILGVILAYVASVASAAVVSILLLWRLYPQSARPVFAWKPIKELYRFSYKQGLARIIGYGLMNANLFVLGYLSNLTEVGIYAAASRLTLVGSLFLEAFGQMFGAVAANKQREQFFRDDYQRVTKWTVVFSTPIFALLATFAPTWMAFMGPDFASSASVLSVLAFSQMLSMFTGSTGFLLSVRGRPGFALLNAVLGWGTSVGMTILLAGEYGALGAAIAYFIAIVVFVILETVECRSVFGFFPVGWTVGKPVVVLSGLLVTAFFIAGWQLWPLLGAILWSGLLLVGYALLVWRWALQPVDLEVFKGLARAAKWGLPT